MEKVTKRLAALALPSLGALLVEPLLVAVDSTMVGRLGTTPLAGLSLAATVLTTIVGICIFLSYATTAATARFVGAQQFEKALRQGLDGMWLGAGLGIILGLLFYIFAAPLLQLFGPEAAVLAEAVSYARASAFGLPGMLLVLAATGTLRGFADTKTPLLATVCGGLLNIPLNITLIYGVGLGVAGAGFGTAISQNLMGAFLSWRIARRASSYGVSLLPSGAGVLKSLHSALPLIIRTLSLRAAILLQIAAAAALGTIPLACNQIVMTMWNFASYGLDSLATAAQILVGQSLGSRNPRRVHLLLNKCLHISGRVGAGLLVVFAGISYLIPRLMSTDPAVHQLSTHTLLITAAALPLAAFSYVLDGILIGAGDSGKLAKYMVFALLTFAPIALFFCTSGSSWGNKGMYGLWVGYAFVFMAARALPMLIRVQKDAWMHLAETLETPQTPAPETRETPQMPEEND
ncbi:MATE family efflux transporter [Arcanobacterium urinimassiliense]|uniref:MATE family efflux transporter n=1 Tax=Arcanobacterium urinimassiliense TaxID=1871014 RepID=UPI00093AAAB3|nr:MATE family efflux transporter [Arcanobacterium urinimassiliense]